MPDRDTLLAMDDAALAELCRLEFFKATGNGGQKRNKTSSAVRVTLEEYGLSAEDCSERSQHRNRAVALRKLRRKLACSVRQSYTPFERQLCSPEHKDYPLYLAHLLDLLCECSWDYRETAIRLNLTPSSLLKSISRDQELFTCYNDIRRKSGLFPVHP